MNKHTFIFVAGCILLLSEQVGQAEGDWNDKTVHLVTSDTYGSVFSCVHRGILFCHLLVVQDYLTRLQTDEYHSEFLYCGKSQYLVAIKDISAFSIMMQEQLDDEKSVDDFVKTGLPRVFYAFFGRMRNSTVIDKEERTYLEEMPPVGWRTPSKTQRLMFYFPPKDEIEGTLKLLRGYEYKGPEINNNRWVSQFFVAYDDGSIEKWHLVGQLQPFKVEQWDKSTERQKGTILPLP